MTDEPKTDAPTGGDKYKRLIAAAQKATRIKVAVAHPCDDVSLSGAIEAHKLGLIDPILVGPPERIRNAARDTGLDISPFELVASAHSHDSAAKAVGLVTAGRVEALMKGSLHTDELMSAVVAHEGGIRTERRISHCFISGGIEEMGPKAVQTLESFHRILRLPPLGLPAPTKDPLKTSTAAAPDDPVQVVTDAPPGRRSAEVRGRLRGRKAEGQSEDEGARVA